MKTKTKKTLIVVAAVIFVAAIVYFAFFRKGGAFNSVINKLDISSGTKSILRKAVSDLIGNPNFDKAAYEADAAEMGISYAAWVVQRVAAMPGVINLIPTAEYEIIMRETSTL